MWCVILNYCSLLRLEYGILSLESNLERHSRVICSGSHGSAGNHCTGPHISKYFLSFWHFSPALFVSFIPFLSFLFFFLSTILPFFFFLSLFSKTEKFPALLGLCWMIDQSVCVPMQLHVSEISMYQWLSFSFCVETQNAGCLPVLRRYICTLKCEVNEVNEENQLA